MLPFKILRQYTQVVDSIKFQLDPANPFLMIYLGENTSFLDDYTKLNIRKIDFRHIVVPLTKIPYSRLTGDLMKQYNKSNIQVVQII